MIVLSILFVCLGAMCNACMDITSFHFHESIFSLISDRDRRDWFDTHYSWRLKYEWKNGEIVGRKKWFGLVQVPVQLTDSWHFCKMFMIVFLCSAVVVYEPFINWFFDMVILGVVWNSVFSFHYNYAFRLDNDYE